MSEDGAILADREITDGCLAITIGGLGNADRVAEDKDHDLALLRIYGARGLKPLALGNGAIKSAVELTGIADPQNQGGGAAASSVKAQAALVGGGGDAALSPAPALGFSGAAALDADGKFAGLALLKPAVVAGAANAAPTAQAVLVPADTVREFLKANGVNAAGGSTDAKAAVVRVICVQEVDGSPGSAVRAARPSPRNAGRRRVDRDRGHAALMLLRKVSTCPRIVSDCFDSSPDACRT